MSESGLMKVMTVARVLAPDEDLVEVTFYESARFYKVPRANPEYDAIVSVLEDARMGGYRVEVGLTVPFGDVIESVERAD
jgi:hypothetical protein